MIFTPDSSCRQGQVEGESAMNIRKIALAIIVVLGVLDIAYGLFAGDRISLLMGPVLILIAVYIAVRERKQAADRQ